MAKRPSAQAAIVSELRKKFRTPKEALAALGLDASIISSRRVAFDGARNMKPNRLQYLVAKGIAQSVNPLLAMDAKVDYTPLFAGLNSANFKARSKTIVADAKKLLKGKTIAKDASVEHLAHLLDQFEHVKEPKMLDESVSPEQHNAMKAAAHGESNLGIPKDVGKEFEEADKGKSFDKMVRDWIAGKDFANGLTEDDIGELSKMHSDCMDEDPEDALDEHEDDDDADDERDDEDDADDESDDADDARHARDRRGARDRRSAKDRKGAKDRRGARDHRGAHDRMTITQDDMDKAIKAAVSSERKRGRDASEARDFVRPYVGEVSMALDSGEAVLRAAAKVLEIDDADTIHASALKPLIKTVGGARQEQSNSGGFNGFANDAALDGTGDASFDKMFGAGRIKTVA